MSPLVHRWIFGERESSRTSSCQEKCHFSLEYDDVTVKEIVEYINVNIFRVMWIEDGIESHLLH
jgi:hypothetical protein